MIIKMSLILGGKEGKAGIIEVEEGQKVNAGDVLANIETGKGNRIISAIEGGVIKKILFSEGDNINSEQPLFEIEELKKEKDETKIPVEIKNIETELLIIGAGPGGYVAAIYAAKKGLKVTIVEKENLGGTCLNIGCIPTKTFVKSAEVFNSIQNARIFGIEASGSVNMSKVIEQKNTVVNQLVGGINALLKHNKVDILEGTAAFLSPNEVVVNGKEETHVSFKNVIIATGSKIANINIPGIDLPFVINSTQALNDTELPKSITIIGGGVIGMEFAFIYRHFGVEVHVVEFLDRLLTMLDEDVSKEIERQAKKAGIQIHTNSKVIKIEAGNHNEAVVVYEKNGSTSLLISDKVLIAIGRMPQVDGLKIENAQVEMLKNAVTVSEYMQTSNKHIYAIGDVNNIMQLAHVASHQGIIAVDHILGINHKFQKELIPNVIFTSPEIASIGLTEKNCKENNINYQMSKIAFSSNGKALSMHETAGFIKLIKDTTTNKIIGGTIIGPDASSLISVLSIAIANGLTDEEIGKAVFAHPTTGEIISDAILEFGIGAINAI